MITPGREKTRRWSREAIEVNKSQPFPAGSKSPGDSLTARIVAHARARGRPAPDPGAADHRALLEVAAGTARVQGSRSQRPGRPDEDSGGP